jgi:hypothetical protein
MAMFSKWRTKPQTTASQILGTSPDQTGFAFRKTRIMYWLAISTRVGEQLLWRESTRLAWRCLTSEESPKGLLEY